jgi:hypothetical protein
MAAVAGLGAGNGILGFRIRGGFLLQITNILLLGVVPSSGFSNQKLYLRVGEVDGGIGPQGLRGSGLGVGSCELEIAR